MTIAKLETNIYPLNVIDKLNEIVDEVNNGASVNVPTKLSDLTDDLGANPIHTHSQYLTAHQNISGKENTSNKVTSLSSNSTDTQYPSAKCVYDLIGNVETLLQAV